MYFRDDLNPRRGNASLGGFAEPSDQQLLQNSRAAIEAALKRNPVGGYVKGSAARQALDDAFDSVPHCLAEQLHDELKLGQSILAKLFNYRLAPPTSATMLDLLKRKAQACVSQQIAERRQRELEELRKMQCEMLARFDQAVEELCRTNGEDSDRCQKARFDALDSREQARRKGTVCK
jgi:hypothetical protein